MNLEHDLGLLADLPAEVPPGLVRQAWQLGRRSHRRQVLLSTVAALSLATAAAAGAIVSTGGNGRGTLGVAAPPGVTVAASALCGTFAAASPDERVPLGEASGVTALPYPTIVPSPGSPEALVYAVTAPSTLPGFPLGRDPSYESDGALAFGWDAAPYVLHTYADGVKSGTPGGPQEHVIVYPRVGEEAALDKQRHQVGETTALGCPARLSRDSTAIWLTLTYDGLAIEATGGSGATADDLVTAVNSLQGLPTTPQTAVTPTTALTASATSASTSPAATDRPILLPSSSPSPTGPTERPSSACPCRLGSTTGPTQVPRTSPAS